MMGLRVKKEALDEIIKEVDEDGKLSFVEKINSKPLVVHEKLCVNNLLSNRPSSWTELIFLAIFCRPTSVERQQLGHSTPQMR